MPRPERSRRRRRDGERGTAAVEFAVVGSVFVMVLLLVFETGWQMAADAALHYGALAAARFGVTGQPGTANNRNTSILDTVLNVTGGVLTANNLSLTMTSYNGLSTVGETGQGTSGGGGSGQFVQYTVTYQQPLLTPLAALIVNASSITHTATIVVQNEPF
jgi:Flp pilus assembly protein TadG